MLTRSIVRTKDKVEKMREDTDKNASPLSPSHWSPTLAAAARILEPAGQSDEGDWVIDEQEKGQVAWITDWEVWDKPAEEPEDEWEFKMSKLEKFGDLKFHLTLKGPYHLDKIFDIW